MTLTINGQEFAIDFRHITKFGKRAQIHKGSVKAVTICTIVVGAPQYLTRPLITSDAALCADADNFSRRDGRNLALQKLLDHCGALKAAREQLWEAYHRAASGIEDCGTCGGRGWMQGEGHDGEACPDCPHPFVIGGTGLKGGQLLFGRGERPTLVTPFQQRVKRSKPSNEAIAALVAAGEAKREARRARYGTA